jgi:hypothetical protein
MALLSVIVTAVIEFIRLIETEADSLSFRVTVPLYIRGKFAFDKVRGVFLKAPLNYTDCLRTT